MDCEFKVCNGKIPSIATKMHPGYKFHPKSLEVCDHCFEVIELCVNPIRSAEFQEALKSVTNIIIKDV